MTCLSLDIRVSNVYLLSYTLHPHLAVYHMFPVCQLMTILPPKKKAADNNRSHGGVHHDQSPSRSELHVISLLMSLILPVIVGDLPWLLTTASSNACARGNVSALGRLNPNH